MARESTMDVELEDYNYGATEDTPTDNNNNNNNNDASDSQRKNGK